MQTLLPALVAILRNFRSSEASDVMDSLGNSETLDSYPGEMLSVLSSPIADGVVVVIVDSEG